MKIWPFVAFGISVSLLSAEARATDGVEYIDACGIDRISESMGGLEVSAVFKSGESICTEQDGCFATKYIVERIDSAGDPAYFSVVTSAPIYLGVKYIVFLRSVESGVVATFPSRTRYSQVKYLLPLGMDYFTSSELVFARRGDNYYRTLSPTGICADSPDCNWADSRGLTDGSTFVGNIEVLYPKFREDLSACRERREAGKLDRRR
jgi:hypothetical protein